MLELLHEGKSRGRGRVGGVMYCFFLRLVRLRKFVKCMRNHCRCAIHRYYWMR